MHVAMLTGPVALMIAVQRQATLFFLDLILFPGSQRSKVLSPDLQQKLNIGAWMLLQLKLCGLHRYFKS
jgi:hypothetical protein